MEIDSWVVVWDNDTGTLKVEALSGHIAAGMAEFQRWVAGEELVMGNTAIARFADREEALRHGLMLQAAADIRVQSMGLY